MTTTFPFAVNDRAMFDVLTQRGYRFATLEAWGPSGLRAVVSKRDMTGAWMTGSIIVTQAENDGADWIHASIAWPTQMPDYYDLTSLHRAVFGRKRWSYQVFAPESRHVNIHEHALHLWGRADGENALPDFGKEGTI